MSLSMFIEIEAGAILGEVRSVLASLSANFEEREEGFSGFFPDSNCYFVFNYDSEPKDIVVEGVEVSWTVGVRGGFHYRADNLHSSWQDIVRLMRAYSSYHSHRFILSFHYETIYAVRGENGLRIVEAMSDGEGVDNNL